MTNHFHFAHLATKLLLLVGLIGDPLGSQTLTAPRYRPRDAAIRATQMVDSITRLAATVGSLRRVMVDTLTAGAFWVEYEPAAMSRSFRASTPAVAAGSFLSRYMAKVLRVDSTETAFRVLSIRTDGDLTHFRYQQTQAGYDVLGGQLTLHLRRMPDGYTMQSANGWLVPDLADLQSARLSRRDAEAAALSVAPGSVRTARDTAAVVVPYEHGTRLAYVVPVFDSTTQDAVVRYVDALTGTVFGQAAAEQTFTPRTAKGGMEDRRSPVETAAGSPAVRASTWSYVLTTGRAWTGETRAFYVAFNGTIYLMADNSHPGTHEVTVRDLAGFPLSGSDCTDRPIIQRDSVPWPVNEDLALEQVSAIHNLGESVTYFYTKFGRSGMRDNPDSNTIACVHATHSSFQSVYDPNTVSLKFRVETSPDGPSRSVTILRPVTVADRALARA